MMIRGILDLLVVKDYSIAPGPQLVIQNYQGQTSLFFNCEHEQSQSLRV